MTAPVVLPTPARVAPGATVNEVLAKLPTTSMVLPLILATPSSSVPADTEVAPV